MEKSAEEVAPTRAALNYFNYFTEVEEEFVRRRGKPLMISPLDWALAESWKNAGIPLHIVLRAINETFDTYAKGQKLRRVSSLFYCQQSVESAFAEYRLAQVGAPAFESIQEADSKKSKSRPATKQVEAFSKDDLLEFLGRCDRELGSALTLASGHPHLEQALARARIRLTEIASEIDRSSWTDCEALERDLDSLDRMLLESIRDSISEEDFIAIREDAQKQLRSYRKKMDKQIYEKTIDNFVARQLREMIGLPRLSLFYI